MGGAARSGGPHTLGALLRGSKRSLMLAEILILILSRKESAMASFFHHWLLYSYWINFVYSFLHARIQRRVMFVRRFAETIQVFVAILLELFSTLPLEQFFFFSFVLRVYASPLRRANSDAMPLKMWRQCSGKSVEINLNGWENDFVLIGHWKLSSLVCICSSKIGWTALESLSPSIWEHLMHLLFVNLLLQEMSYGAPETTIIN